MNRKVRLVILALLATAPRAAARELPEAPKGFHWSEATKIKSALLTPGRWFFREEERPKVIAYVVSREDSHAGKFQVGLTVNVKRVTSGNAVDYAKKIVTVFPRSAGKKLHKGWDVRDGALSGGGCEVEFDALVMQLVVLANPKTGLVYIITFEAPKAEWEEAWRSGQQIMTHLVLNADL